MGKLTCSLINLLAIITKWSAGFLFVDYCLFKHFFFVSGVDFWYRDTILEQKQTISFYSTGNTLIFNEDLPDVLVSALQVSLCLTEQADSDQQGEEDLKYSVQWKGMDLKKEGG